VSIALFLTPQNLKLISHTFSAAPLQRGDPDIAFSLYGALKLADRFLIDPLKDMILSHIHEDWPQSLHGWDEREALYLKRLKSSPTLTMDDVAPEPASVIRLARTFEPKILTLAFYHLSRLPVNAVYKQGARNSRGVRTHLLSPADREKAMVGRERMLKWLADRMEACMLDTWNCNAEGPCHLHIYWRAAVLHRTAMRNLDVLSTLRSMRSHKLERGTSQPMEDVVCSDCNARWDQILSDARRDFFDSLSSFFPDL
jgi:hypothetical protein